jgi:hypothetical protein
MIFSVAVVCILQQLMGGADIFLSFIGKELSKG